MIKLNLGCGADRRPGFIGVDLFDGPQVDQIHDLDHGPWPWDDASAEHILARHIFEHVSDPVLFMAESWRVLRPGGMLEVATPHWKSRDAYTDPTHRRFPTEHTFDYWVPGTFLRQHHGAAYTGVTFQYACQPSIVAGQLLVNLIKTVEKP
jgi:predicted SAM-dependent methyltransferase